MRILVIHQNPQAQIHALFSSNLSAEEAAAAREALKRDNPHVDLDALKSGAVLVIPGTKGFEPSASSSAAAGPLDDLQTLVRKTFQITAQGLKQTTDARAAQRAAVAAALKTVADGRIGASDAELQQKLGEAQKALEQDSQTDAQGAQALTQASQVTLAKLAELGKILG